MGARRKIRTHGFAALTLAALLGVFAALMTWTRAGQAFDGPGAVPVRLIDNGFHTDLAVPRTALMDRGGPLAQAVETLEPGDWVLVGWGDARFYVETTPIHTRLPDGARAFFARGNRSVVMLYPVSGDPAERAPAGQTRSWMLSDAAFDALASRVERSLDLTAGAPRIGAVRTNPGDYGADARFFASTETFWIGHLCNHWTSQLLHAAGLDVRPFRSIVAKEVVASVDRELDTDPRED